MSLRFATWIHVAGRNPRVDYARYTRAEPEGTHSFQARRHS